MRQPDQAVGDDSPPVSHGRRAAPRADHNDHGAHAPDYEDAVAHYLSGARRDAVKRLWEEPVNHRLIAAALAAVDPGGSRPLTVVDIGAGTGDGLALFEAGLAQAGRAEHRWRYIGIDPDPAMVETANALHRDRPNATFIKGDVREPLPVGEADLYLSAGVPWSHLTHLEFIDALTTLFTSIARSGRVAAVVIDVLGRYSIEWAPRWSLDHWDYAMSFFEGAEQDGHLHAPMSFHSRWSLDAAIRTAERRSGVVVSTVDYRDRSVMVGRHTSTGTFNPSLPRYRELINALTGGDTTVDLEALRFAVPDQAAPDEIRTFFSLLRDGWNSRINQAQYAEMAGGARAETRAALVADLRAFERETQHGLGAAHSLIALTLVDPSPSPTPPRRAPHPPRKSSAG